MNLKEICQTLSREIQKLVPYDRAAINILQRDEKFFSVYAEESRLPASAIPEGVSVREGTATSWVLDHKEPVICRDVLKDPRFPLTHKRYKSVGLRSYVILPLMVKGKALGALNLGSLKPRCYGKKEITILSPVAEILSLAIENSNLYEESQRREEMQKLLKELSQDVTSLDINSLLKKLTEQVIEILKVDICDIRMIQGESWSLVAISGVDPSLTSSTPARTPYGRMEWILQNRKPLVIPDSDQEGSLPPGETVKALGGRGYLGVPMLSGSGKVTGVIRALTYQPREFTQEEVDFLQQLANEAAAALENARLIANLESANLELERSFREQHTLREFLSNILLLDLDKLLKRLTEQVASFLQAEFVWVRLFDEKGSIRTRAVTGDEAVVRLMNLGEEGKLVGRGRWMLDNRRPLAVKDMAQDPLRPYHGAVKAADLHGFLGAPLFSREQKPLGVIFVTTRFPREFTQRDLNLIEQFAAGAAIAIENARLFEQLQEKSEELEEAYKTKSTFFNTMAHELRTPLNVLIATLQLFTEGYYGELSEKQVKGFEPLQRNAMNLLNLIGSILDLARLEAKRVPLKIEAFSLKEITDELESSLMPLAQEKGVELRLKLGDPTLTLKSDRSKIKSVLQNLLGNAVKYTDKGEIELRITTLPDHESSPSGAEAISIAVQDTGIGIKEGDIPHIFEAFYMAEGINRRKYPGSGLGLSIVKRLLELLHGDIQVQSEWGKGSTFTATLPLVHPTGPSLPN